MNQTNRHNRKALRQDSLVVQGPRTLIWLAGTLACVTFATKRETGLEPATLTLAR